MTTKYLIVLDTRGDRVRKFKASIVDSDGDAVAWFKRETRKWAVDACKTYLTECGWSESDWQIVHR